MDPVTAFANIATLVAEFRASRTAAKGEELREFQDWLTEIRHENLAAQLRDSTKAAIGIKALLTMDRQRLHERLDLLDNSLARIVSTLDGFDQLAEAIRPNASLSEQAISILVQLNDAKQSHVVAVPMPPELLLVLPGPIGAMNIDEQQFVEDDLRTLVELGLLRVESEPDSDRVFHFTREAARLVAARKSPS